MKYLIFFLSAAALAGDQMNGIRLDAYKDFQKNWHLVTVRYRKDTGEMRVTYANPKAWQVLKEGKTDYSDGAIFAKIGIATSEDAAFSSSVVPSGARRYQFMVRDKKKYKDTDGWGYALFDSQGKTLPESEKTQAVACAACHRLVPERAFVFSQPWNISAWAKSAGVEELAHLKFTDIAKTKLPKAVQALLPSGATKVRAVDGALQDQLFQGTLDEIKPALSREAAINKTPALLLSRDQTRFSLVIENTSGSACNKGPGIEMLAINTNHQPVSQEYTRLSFCYEAKP